MDRSTEQRCSRCQKIAREIDEALVETLRLTEHLREARKRADRALEAKREHEMRTGHAGTS